jgi:ribosomal protein L5
MTKAEAIRNVFEKYGLLANRIVHEHLKQRGFKSENRFPTLKESSVIAEVRQSYRERLEQELKELQEIEGQNQHYPYAHLTIFRRIQEIKMILMNDPENYDDPPV